MSAGLVSQHQQSAFSTPINGAAGDATVVLGNDNATVSTYNAHDADPTIHVQSSTAAVFAATPAGTAGRKWMTNDAGVVYLYYDTGSAWVEANYQRVATNGTVVIVSTTAPQLTVEYDSTHKATWSVTSGGALTINATSTITITPATTISGAVTHSSTTTLTGLATFNGGATIASGQTLTVTGATITGLTAASVGAGTFPAGAFVFAGAVSGITTLVTTSTINGQTISSAASFTGTVTAATYFYGSNQLKPQYTLAASGANYGLIQNDDSTHWSLAYGASQTALGTPVLKWDSSGNVTIPAGTTAVQALTVTGTLATTTGQASFTLGNTPVLINNTLAASNYRAIIQAQRGSTDRYYIGTDSSDQFVLTNAAANAANLTVTDAGALTVRSTVTASAFASTRGTGSALNSTATTFYTISTVGTYLVSLSLDVLGNIGTYIVVYGGGALSATISSAITAGSGTVTVSALDIQVTQSSGSTKAFTWNILKIA